MQTSPLYPGFTPDAKQGPLRIPGYFPGAPIYRRPGKYRPERPNEYSFDLMKQFIDQLGFDLGAAPTWVQDQIISDFTRQFSTAISPRDFNYDIQRAIETGELDETPGVALRINLNPLEWIEDPNKQMTKMLMGWKDAIINWDDIESYAEHKKIWEPLIRGEDPKTWLTPVSKFGKQVFSPFKLTGLGVMETGGDDTIFTFDPDDPTKLIKKQIASPTSPDKTIEVKKDKDVYAAVGTQFIKFQDNADSAASRNSEYNRFLKTSVDAVKTDVQNNENNILKLFANASPTEQVEIKRRIDYFYAKADAATAMFGVKGLVFLKGNFSNLSAELGSYFFQGNNATHIYTEEDGITRKNITFDSLLDNIYKVKTDAGGNVVVDRNGRITQEGFVGKALTNIDKARGKIAGNQEYLDKFNTEIKDFENHLEKIKKLQEDYRREAIQAAGDETRLRFLAGRLKGQLDRLDEKFAGSDYFKGIYDKYMSNFVNNEVFGGKGVIGELFVDSQGKGLAIDPGNTLVGYNNLARVVRTAKRTYDINDASDFIRALESGKLVQTYAWVKVRKYMNGFTPAAVTGEYLKRVHYFGLIYDGRTDDLNQRLNKVNKAYRWYGVAFAKFIPEHTFKLEVPWAKLKLKGGDHFEGALTMQEFLRAKDEAGGQFVKGVGLSKEDSLDSLNNADNKSSIVKFLSGDRTAFDVAASNETKLRSDLAKVDTFRTWLIQNSKMLGLKLDNNGNLDITDQNNQRIFDLIRALGITDANQNNLSILLKRASFLQHVSSWANHIQDLIVKTAGKILSPYFVAKKASIEALSEAISGFLIQAFAAGTAGLGEMLAPLIDRFLKPIVKLVVAKVYNTSEAFVMAVFRQDFSGFKKDLEKGFSNTMKTMSYVAFAPLGCALFIGFVVVYPLLSGVSSYDNARNGGYVEFTGGGDGEGTPPPPIPGASCPLAGTYYVSTPSYTTASARGHGSNGYWDSVSGSGKGCTFTIPYVYNTQSLASVCPPVGDLSAACGPSQDTTSRCYTKFQGQPKLLHSFYGYAADVRSDKDTVYLPEMGGVTEWTLAGRVSIFHGASGYGQILVGQDAEHAYKIYLGHLESFWISDGSTGKPGDALAYLYDGWGVNRKHVHIEVMIDGVPTIPDSMCK